MSPSLLFPSLAANKQSEISQATKELKKGEHTALSGTRALFTFVQPTAKLKITYRYEELSSHWVDS